MNQKVPKKLNVVVAQINLLVGDIEGNAQQVIRCSKEAVDRFSADVIIFPELTLTGYPPEDLLLRPWLIDRVESALKTICSEITTIDVVLGLPSREGDALYNTAVVISGGSVIGRYHKHCLPNYSVFDEKRYFKAGEQACVVEIKNIKIGITICEDIWFAAPLAASIKAGAELIININASPFHISKGQERIEVLRRRVAESDVPIIYANLVGGQDELVFDGASFVMNRAGEVVFQAPYFEENLYSVKIDIESGQVESGDLPPVEPLSELASIYKALVTGVRDYARKNRFPGVVIGLSGGIDSALTLVIAADALGAEQVEAVMMPSRYTSDMSLRDAAKEAENLGIHYHILSIEPAFDAIQQTLLDVFKGLEQDVTEENIQARCRGILLMAISNKKNKLVLTTGNKSEMAVGYATLYGDMAGGFNALKDVPKTLVYKLAEYRNSISAVIPQSVIHRAPSAELAPDQKDADSLPDYGELDSILELYVEKDQSLADIVKYGYDESTVKKVIRLVDLSEYKRRQAAPGVRITRRAFGRDRRYPITSGFNK